MTDDAVAVAIRSRAMTRTRHVDTAQELRPGDRLVHRTWVPIERGSAYAAGSLATSLLEMPIAEWSLRISDDWPEDPADDVAGEAWAGKIRFTDATSVLEPAPDLRNSIEPSPSILAAQESAGSLI